ncbi:MAG TPA: YIP1 family protein [Candidatus Acidoferrum sp.]|nr:YIP1 family protein [Candidatus Acidoferrum sp.]HYW40939.1 YIP1 family protein [Terriglobales bacterium]
MATTPVPAAEPRPAISPLGRVVGVLFSPKGTFEDIVRKPSWLLPVLIATVLGIVSTVVLNQRINWRDYILQQIDKSPRAAQLSTEQKQQQAEISTKVTVYIVYAVGALGSVLFALIVGAVMMLAYNVLAGAGATFSQSLGIAAHTLLVGIFSTPIFLLVLLLRPPGTVDPENPVATNVAAFLPEESAKWLIALCKSIDIFTIWTLLLLAIGFAAVNPRKLKGSKPYVVAFSVWGAFVVVKVLWAFIFS